MTELPRIISVDDHVIEPAHLFETWLPRKCRDRGPKPPSAYCYRQIFSCFFRNKHGVASTDVISTFRRFSTFSTFGTPNNVGKADR